MRRLFATLLIVLLAAFATQASGAGKRTVRWVRSVYVDAKGVGLQYPEGVACRGESFVVADTGNRRLVLYRHQNDEVEARETIAVGKASPIKVEWKSEAEVYFLDGRERRIMSLDVAGGEAEELEPEGVPRWREVVPKSFAVDDRGGVYILDIFGRRAIVLDAAGRYQRQLPLPDSGGFITDIAVDARGRIHLVDAVTAVVYAAAQGEERFSPLTESTSEFANFPSRIAVDSGGVIYLVDQHGSGLVLLGPDGSLLGRQLGMGWDEGELYYPAQVCISGEGHVYVADRNNSRIQIFRAAGAAAKSEGEAEAPEAADE